MANRNFKNSFFTLVDSPVLIFGHVNLSTSGTISSQVLSGATCTRINTGSYRITLADPYFRLESATFQLQHTGSNPLFCVVSGSSVRTDKTVDFFVKEVSGSTGVGLNSSSRNVDAGLPVTVFVDLKLKNTAV